MNLSRSKKNLEKRIKMRKPYSGHIFFTTKKGFHEGKLKNFSPSGLFIRTKASLSIGEIITIALPFSKANQAKYQGQVLWSNRDGVGIELFKKRNDYEDYIRLL
jgi:PilZ domain